MFKEKVNLGVNELWYVAYKDYKPYEDRLRSTNTKEFKRDTTLDEKMVVEVGLEPTINTV
jgi:hypothetical protein